MVGHSWGPPFLMAQSHGHHLKKRRAESTLGEGGHRKKERRVQFVGHPTPFEVKTKGHTWEAMSGGLWEDARVQGLGSVRRSMVEP